MNRRDPLHPLSLTRRHFLSNASLGLGSLALSALLPQEMCSKTEASTGVLGSPHFPARAKRVIYLFQSGGPAQQDLFDYKPLLNEKNGEQLPEHVRGGQRLTGMSVNQASIPLAGWRSAGCGSRSEDRRVGEVFTHTANMGHQ